MKNLLDEAAPPAITLNFVHFRGKVTVYSLRKKASKFRQPLKGKLVFIRKRLPYRDAEIKNTAENMSVITTTHNCQVKVLVILGDRKVFKQINDLKQLAVLKNQPFIKQQHFRGSDDFRRKAVGELHIEFPSTREKQPTYPPCKKT